MAKDVRELTLALMNARAAGATVCPSEVARAFVEASETDSGNPDWRSVMPSVHAEIDKLVAEGVVRLTWKGKILSRRNGPYRIGRNIKAE